jgi:phosphatidylglycerophosphate synthase
MNFDLDKMNKFPPGARFFDINEIWYFTNRWVVRFLCPLPVTANQITFLSLLTGLISAGFYFSGLSNALVWGAVFLYIKIYLDNVDGNLARVRGEVSRLGRFFDSLTDFSVTFLVFAGVTYYLVQETGQQWFWALGLVALVSGLMHCSFFVFYLVKYAGTVGTYSANRVHEKVTEEDEANAENDQILKWELFLQRLHVWIYGWQDTSVQKLDGLGRRMAGIKHPNNAQWYADKKFLSLSSPLCLCTNNMVLVIFSLFNAVESGLWLVAVLGNGFLFGLLAWKIFRARCFAPSV